MDGVYQLKAERQDGDVTVTGHGTAFAIGKHRLLTAAHCVKGYDVVRIVDGDDLRACKVEKIDADLDLAILSSKLEMTPLELGDDQESGAKVTMIGSLRGKPLGEYAGTVVSKTRIAVKFDHGASGGPVICGGKVCAIAVAGVPQGDDMAHDVGCVVPASAVRLSLAAR